MDPDQDFLFDADVDVDPDQDADPGYQNDADPGHQNDDPCGSGSTKLIFWGVSVLKVVDCTDLTVGRDG